MKNLLWLTPIVLSSSLILPGCDKGAEDPAPISQSSPSTTPDTTTAKMSDSDLENVIRTKLESDDAVKQANLSVSADVDDNKATISGTVVSQDLRAKAIDLAKSAQPGLTIEDKIDVKPAA
jgi:osmotically-inducible protein OsmY